MGKIQVEAKTHKENISIMNEAKEQNGNLTPLNLENFKNGKNSS
jgi:hypothetical protein